MKKNKRILAPTSFDMPLPTSTTKVGEELGTSSGTLTIKRSITPHQCIGTTKKTMGIFPVKPSTTSQSQRKLRPSYFKKLVEKFDETKDPHYHMANIRQVINAKNVYEWHTIFKGYGMTLDGAALDLFRDLPKGAYTTLDQPNPDFIEAFSLTGIKHNTVTKIYNFKQLETETVRDCSK